MTNGAPPHHNPPPGVPPGGNPGAAPPPDSYFTETRKGEVNELRQLLRTFSSERDPNRKRDIIKKVIAYMTLGIDVSRLFTEMMLAIETRDLVIKKMVYLFLCNYATTHPELAQMCTNTLQKDCGNDDPMVRGLALRALCSLRLPQMVEYISEPLRKSLTDNHAYVRKTGVMGILKLYHLDTAAFERCNFVDILYDMLRDPDASVVSNCILVLGEIMSRGENGGMAINRPIILHLLNRIHEFSEFGIVAVLDLVPRYTPANEEEAYQMMNLLDPILRTSNSAAVLGTIRAFLSLAEQMEDSEEMTKQVVMRVKAPLVTITVSSIPELTHCLLKNIDVLIDIAPGVFDDEYRQFYIRYTEPSHVKFLKLQILPKLANDVNSPEIVVELAEYVDDVNTKLSRLALRALARIACRLSSQEAAEGIVLRLVEYLDDDSGHISSEAATSLSMVLRKHPHLKELTAHRLPRALRYIKEPSGKTAILFLLGEYADHVPGAPYAVEKLIDGYDNISSPDVKRGLLHATIKLFFKRPPECQKMLGRLLKKATEDVSNQDLHDRALMYYRLLRASPNLAEAVVGTSVTIPVGKAFCEDDDEVLRDELMREFNSLSILYGKTQENFIQEEYRVKFVRMAKEEAPHPPAQAPTADLTNETGIETDMAAASLSAPVGEAPPTSSQLPNSSQSEVVADLLDFGDSATPAPPALDPSTVTPTTALSLTAMTMTGDDYQTLWSAQPDLINITIPFSVLPSTSDVESLLAECQIMTMASGELPAELKFFLYCRESEGSGSVYLLQLAIQKSPVEMGLVMKTDHGEKAEQLVEVVKQALKGYIM